MSVQGVFAVADVETTKLAAQWKVRLVLISCAAGPFAFAAALRLQSSLPTDTLFGRAIDESGFAVPLVILGFAAFWVLPAAASIVGGDLFSAEDRYGTWATVLTRSRGRAELFAGKAVAAIGFTIVAIAALAVSSIAAGALIIGRQPLIDLLRCLEVCFPGHFARRARLGVGVIARRRLRGAGDVDLNHHAQQRRRDRPPVVIGLTMQLGTMLDGREAFRQMLIASAFGGWYGLMTDPPYYRPLVYGGVVSAAYIGVCLAAGYRLLQQRDIGR